MINLITEHWLISILSTLILGALSNGLWEVAFKPFFRKFGEVLFFVLTLGMKKSSDSVYVEAAKGYREQSGMFISQHYVMFFSFVIILTTFFVYQHQRTLVLDAPIAKSVYLECEGLETPYEKKQCIKNIIKKKIFWSFPLLIILGILLIVLLTYYYLWMSRVNSVITDFKQYLAICKPYLTNNQIMTFDQRFALLTDRDGFSLITEELSEIAEEHNIQLPRLDD